MNGSRDRRPHIPGSEDETVEVPLRAPGKAQPPATEEPWWKNVNTRIPPPPPPTPRPPARAPLPPMPRATGRPDRQTTPVRNRHAKTASPRPNGGRVALLIALGVIAISAGAIGIMVGLSRFDVLRGKVLDVSKAEVGVQRILVDPADGYGATSVTNVVCNNGNDPEIKKGATFTCDVVVDGRKRQVLVVFQDDEGTYEVDRPR